MTVFLGVVVDQIRVFRDGEHVKGIAKVNIADWGIQIDNLTWKLERGGVKVKFPVIKQGDASKKPLFLVAFEKAETERELKREIAKQVKAYLSEKALEEANYSP